MKLFLLFVATCLTFPASGQTYRDLVYRADSAYNAKAFALAGPRYLTAAQRADFDFERRRLCPPPPAHRNPGQLYRDEYFAKASPGLQDYYAYKIGSIESFVRTHDKLPRFYAAIRPNTMRVEAMKKQMMQSFANFKSIYPNAKFPPVYFVIGGFSSGGTASNNA